jgi:predicted transcriptional regulator
MNSPASDPQEALTVSVTLRIQPSLATAIDELATTNDRCRGGMIRKILIDYVKQAKT